MQMILEVKNTMNQKGVALLLVLLVFLLASILSISVIENQQLDISRTRNLFTSVKLYNYALSAEAMAAGLLQEDYRLDVENNALDEDDSMTDSSAEAWARPYYLEENENRLRFVLFDAQAQINVNSMVNDNQLDQVKLKSLTNYLMKLGLPLDINVAEHIMGTAYGNNDFASVGEFAEMFDVNIQTSEILEACLSALPQHAAINLNTASQATLESFSDILTEDVRQNILEERSRNKGLQKLPSIAGGKDGFTLKSEFFTLLIQAENEGNEILLKSMLYRNSETGDVVTVARAMKMPDEYFEGESYCPDTGGMR